jgi:hypothetical protein
MNNPCNAAPTGAATPRRRAATVTLAAVVATPLAAAPASAHSPNDFLKVPVGKLATVLLPPMTAPAEVAEAAVIVPPDYRVVAASAGPGWTARIAPQAAILDRSRPGQPLLLLALSGVASTAGRIPVQIRISAPTTTTRTFHYTLTALADYQRAADPMTGAARPDAPVANRPGATTPLLLSLLLAAAGAAVLVVRRPHRRRAITEG